MYTAEALQADILETAKFAAQTFWRGTLEWQRQPDMRPTYCAEQLSPAGRTALEAHIRGDERGVHAAMLDGWTHWDSVIFSTVALSQRFG